MYLREVFTFLQSTHIGGSALSPDGRTIAVARDDQATKQTIVTKVDVDGSGYRELSVLPGMTGTANQTVTWTSDGRGILVAIQTKGTNYQIMRVPADGSKAESTGLEATIQGGFDLSPDGSRIAFSGVAANTPSLARWIIYLRY